jgi:hypothetical protein
MLVIQMNGTASGGGHHESACTLVLQMNGTASGGGHHESACALVLQMNGTLLIMQNLRKLDTASEKI